MGINKTNVLFVDIGEQMKLPDGEVTLYFNKFFVTTYCIL